MGTLNKLKSVIARNDLLLRGIIPLVAYSSWMLPSILQNSMIFIGCSVSALYALSDIKQWFKRAYYHFIEPQTQHFREGLVDITLMSIQLYLSIIQSTGMAHHFISKKSIFNSQISAYLEQTYHKGRELAQSGLSLLFIEAKYTIQSGYFRPMSDWINKYAEIIAFSFMATTLLTTHPLLHLFQQPVSAIYCVLSLFMVTDIIHQTLFSKRATESSLPLHLLIHIVYLLSWSSILLISSKAFITPALIAKAGWLKPFYKFSNFGHLPIFISSIITGCSQIIRQIDSESNNHPMYEIKGSNRDKHLHPSLHNNVKAQDIQKKATTDIIAPQPKTKQANHKARPHGIHI
ncbi:MAG: hypothetical protein VXZ73_04540 [Pseudomonadota bacterium]|nr:hypothetical protein [Pseudomonadota bacterium]